MPRSKEIPEDLRKKAVDAYQSGKGYKAISKALGLPRTTVRAILCKWRKFGIVVNLPRSGRPAEISPVSTRPSRKIVKDITHIHRTSPRDPKASLASAKKLLKATQKKSQQRILAREKELQDLRQAVQSLTRSAQAAVEDSDRILTELICSIERRCSEVKELIRDQEKAAVSEAEGLLERLEQEIAELRRRDAELEQISNTQDYIHFLQNWKSLCAPPVPGDLPSITVNPHLSFEAVGKSVSELKERLEDVCNGELVKISQAVSSIASSDAEDQPDWLDNLEPEYSEVQEHKEIREGAQTSSVDVTISSEEEEDVSVTPPTCQVLPTTDSIPTPTARNDTLTGRSTRRKARTDSVAYVNKRSTRRSSISQRTTAITRPVAEVHILEPRTREDLLHFTPPYLYIIVVCSVSAIIASARHPRAVDWRRVQLGARGGFFSWPLEVRPLRRLLKRFLLLLLSVSPPQLSNLLLQSLQESFSPTHCSLLLISDQLFHLRAPSLNGADQLSKDPLTCGSVGLSPTGLESCPTLDSSLADWRRALTEARNGSSSSQLLSSPLVSTHRVLSLYLFEVWYRQQLLQSGEELPQDNLQSCVSFGLNLHWRRHLREEGKKRQPHSELGPLSVTQQLWDSLHHQRHKLLQFPIMHHVLLLHHLPHGCRHELKGGNQQ
ncbi:hypothetical protein JZ751_016269, partial [Albula glossodonta]